MLRFSAIDEFCNKFRRDAFEVDAKLTNCDIPGKPLLMNPPKGSDEIANRGPNAFNGIGMNLTLSIAISVYCPLPLAMTDRGMTAIES